MAIDVKKIDKKKVGIIVLAVLAGFGAVALTNSYINTSVSKGASSEEINALFGKIQKLEQENKALYQRQDAYAGQLQKKLDSFSQAQLQRRPKSEEKAFKEQSLALKTPPGKRAVTVRIETLSAVGGLINPGDFVDVLAHIKVAGDPGDSEGFGVVEKTTITLFQNVQVLAIGPNVEMPGNFEVQQKTTTLPITLAVDPEQVEMITFAQAHGKLQLVLRGLRENSEYRLPSGNWETFNKYLLETQGVVISAPNAPKKIIESGEVKSNIKIFRGGAE
ncbi:MAG: Flp pilus assembly protein CpaB [Candidatus Aceula lacicola]|nr:Flp pilus assembly protein CpaB [Candidatus Aceula lacicola]